MSRGAPAARAGGRPGRCGVGAALALLALLAPRPARAESFADRLDRPITRPIARALADSVGRALPLTSASSGITFRFDFATGAFERETRLFGQLFLERAEPLGRGTWNVAVSVQDVDFDSFDGHDLSSLRDPGPPIVTPANGRLFTVPRFRLGLDTTMVTPSVTYGLTDAIDVNIALPVLSSDFALDAEAVDLASGRMQYDHIRRHANGVGDLFLRGKYRFWHTAAGSLASGLVLRVPTGDEDDFQGTGDVDVSPFLYASTGEWRLVPWLRLQAYANAGLDLDASDVDRSEARFGVGLDVAVLERVTVAVAVLGREPFSRLAPPGTFDVLRRNPRTGRASVSPVFGLDPGRPHYWDVGLGGRLLLWRDRLYLTGNVFLPITDDGFRADVVPLLGLEAVF